MLGHLRTLKGIDAGALVDHISPLLSTDPSDRPVDLSTWAIDLHDILSLRRSAPQIPRDDVKLELTSANVKPENPRHGYVKRVDAKRARVSLVFVTGAVVLVIGLSFAFGMLHPREAASLTKFAIKNAPTYRVGQSGRLQDGQSILASHAVTVSCRAKVVNAGVISWWYLIKSTPWRGNYFSFAGDLGPKSQLRANVSTLQNVDDSIPACGGKTAKGAQEMFAAAHWTGSVLVPVRGSAVTEVSGGLIHTWSDYMNASGSRGSMIEAYARVQVACRIAGLRVADGNVWWYLIASPPWSNGYYATADGFYNDGQTSGSLNRTPFDDPKVPVC
jgi:hypothetical protein